MTTSDRAHGGGGSPRSGADRVFVWVWLPGAVEPVVAGVLARARGLLHGQPVLAFRYASSYRARPGSISLFPPELPLSGEVFDPRRVPRREPLALAGCLRDAAPDAWGRRVVNLRPVVKAEAVAMMLAARSGLSVARVEVRRVAGKDVLLVERFDRKAAVPARRSMVSMLTVLGVSEMNSRYGSYAELAETIRTGPWVRVPETLREVYARLVFNVCVGNTDDHLRNHAAFWDGASLELTPAYDLAPQVRSTNTASQAIGITRDGARASQLRLCREVAAEFLISPAEADEIIDLIVTTIQDQWDDACDQACLTRAERAELMGREFLNPYVEYSAP